MQNILQNTHKKAEETQNAQKAEETQNAEEAEKAQNAGKTEKAINAETPEMQKSRKAEPRVIKKQMLVCVRRLSGCQKQNLG